MKKKDRMIPWSALGLLGAFGLWTAAVCTVDVQPIGPMGSSVGFASLNQWFHGLTGVHWKMYILTDWLSLVPVLFVLVRTLKKKRLTPQVVFFGAFLGFTGVMLLLTLTHHVSTYYYYKSYYPLWMFCWLLTAQAVSIMLQEAKEVLIAYCTMIAISCFRISLLKILRNIVNIFSICIIMYYSLVCCFSFC